MKHSNLMLITMMISSLLLIATNSVQAAEITITDIIEDVSSVDFNQQTTVVTSDPNIDVSNIDITKATYDQVGTQATVTLQVRGIIENRGKIIDMYNSEDSLGPLNFVEYDFSITTTEQDYTVSYANQTGQISNGLEAINITSSDFSVTGDTLTITFQLTSEEEVYENMSVTSMFVKMNFSASGEDFSDFVYLSDIAPNPALEIMEAYGPNVGAVGDTIQFNGSIIPLTGQPPYQYHWDFGDGESSTQMNPTHDYTKAGEYTYTFTVTDQAGDAASETGSITISTEGGENGGSGLSSTMIMFLAILAIVVIVGVVIIIWIIRR